ncbi:CBS domain-containing protein [Streptomyces sp. NPDC059037]|uniref:CBS domain-containing protein n=1 Tax=Streptomyces sp. NPDC059037 TaxID=3346710 RepID=UPI00368D6155
MRAHDLAEPYPTVSTDDDAVDAARLFVERKLPALLVLDRDQRPYAIVPGSQLLRVAVPDFVLDEPSLAVKAGDTDLEMLTEQLSGMTVAQWLPPRRILPTVVGPGASAMEIAALMVRTHTPLVAVVESDGRGTRTTGAITAARLMEHLLTPR